MRARYQQLSEGGAIFPWLVLAIALQGCGAPAKKAPVAAPPTNQIPAHDLVEAKGVAQTSQLTCADAKSCPPSVGFLTASWSDKATMCTSFLVAPDVLATNGHCLPDDLRKAGADCSGRIWVRFTDGGTGPGEQVACKTVLQTTPKGRVSDPDYAFVQLEHKLSRTPYPFSHEGLADGASLTMFKIDPVPGNVAVGVLVQTTCKTPQKTLITPNFDSELGQVATVADCKIIHGNSGSPLIDSTGRVRAIIHAKMDPKILSDSVAKQAISLSDGELAPLGLATNLACVHTAVESGDLTLPAGCAAESSRSSSPSGGGLPDLGTERTAANEKANHEIGEALTASPGGATLGGPWTSQPIEPGSPLDVALRKQLSPDAPNDAQSGAYYVAVPSCVPASTEKSTTVTAPLDLPLVRLGYSVNRYTQPHCFVSPVTQWLKAKFEYTLGPTGGNGPIPVKLTAQDGDAAQSLLDGSLPTCH